MPILETKHLILRDFVLSDWDALNAFLSDPSVTRFMHFASWDEAKRREWLQSLVKRASDPDRDKYDWAITLKGNGALVGWLIIGRSPRSPKQNQMRECGCGYALNRLYWGNGYMPEALSVAFAYAFNVLGTFRIFADCELGNTASARVMQKIGMEYEGLFSDDDGEGNWARRYRYSMTREQAKNIEACRNRTIVNRRHHQPPSAGRSGRARLVRHGPAFQGRIGTPPASGGRGSLNSTIAVVRTSVSRERVAMRTTE